MSLVFNPSSSGSRSWVSLCSSIDGNYIAALDNTLTTYGVYISNDNGNTWTTVTSGLELQSGNNNKWVSICCSRDFQKIAALRTSGYIYISQDYGITWTKKPLPSGIVFPPPDGIYHNNYNGYEICGSSTLSVIYAIIYQYPDVNSNILLVSTNSGNTWSKKNFTITDIFGYNTLATSICCSSDGTKLGIGGPDNIGILTSTNYGNTFTVNSQVSGTIIRCDDNFNNFITLSIDVFFGGYGYVSIFKQGTSTSLMSNTSTSTYNTSYKLCIATNPDFTRLAYIHDSGSSVYLNYSNNSGQTFTNISYNFNSISLTNNGLYGVARNDGFIWNGINNATSEKINEIVLNQQTTLGTTYDFQNSCCSNDFSKIYLASNVLNQVGLFYSNNYGNTFTQYTAITNLPVQTTGKTWTAICCSNDGNKIAGVRTSDNIYFYNGTTWNIIYTSTTINWTGIAGNYDLSKLVAVANNGNIYTYNGTSWTTTNAPITTWNNVCCDDNMINIAAAATTTSGNIYISNNSGSSWNRVITGNWTEIYCTYDFSKLIACQGGTTGKIYVSYDSGVTWGITSAPSRSWGGITANKTMNKIIAAGGRLSGIDTGVWYSQDYGMTWNSSGLSKTWLTTAMDDTNNFIIAAGVFNNYVYIGDLNGYKYTKNNLDVTTFFQTTTQDSSSNISIYSTNNYTFNFNNFFTGKYLKPFTTSTSATTTYGSANPIGFTINGTDIASYCCPIYDFYSGNTTDANTGANVDIPLYTANNISVKAGAVGMLVVLIGAGGGGGAGGSKSNAGATGGAGGGGGGLFAIYIPVSSSTYNITVGGGGKYGITNNNSETNLKPGQIDYDSPNNPGGAGGAGGNTTFTYNSTTYTCYGGSGGSGGPQGTGTVTGANGGIAGTISGSGTYTTIINQTGNNSPNVLNAGQRTPGGKGGLSGNYETNSYSSTNRLINGGLISLTSVQKSINATNIPTTQGLIYGEGGNGGRGDGVSGTDDWGACGEYGACGCIFVFWYY